MLAFVIAGLVVGGLAWCLKHEPGDPRIAAQLIVGVVGAVIGGVGMNVLVLDEDLMTVTAWGFAAAAVVALVVLGLLQAGVGRRPADADG